MKPSFKINFVSVAVNGIKLYKLVKKLIRQLRREGKMCFKKWFSKPPEVPLTGYRVGLSSVINNYPGTANDLNGCHNDQINAETTLKKYWPDFAIRKYKDAEVTRANFKNTLNEALNEKWDTVIMFMDCCFSEDNTRDIHHAVKAKFVAPEHPIVRHKVVKHIARSVDMKWIAFSACQDYQTAADAYIGGNYNGAFTWAAMKVLRPEMTYYDWFLATKTLLAQSSFEQIPEMQGPDYLLNKKVFSDKTLFVQYSGHGTYTPDRNGDEADNQDEAMYVYDGMILDDELSEILTKC